MKNTIDAYNERFQDASPLDVITFFHKLYGKKIAFASSMGAEDQVLTHLISESAPGMRIFTLDTGRMFEETYDLIAITEKRYNTRIQLFFPDPSEVENMVESKGINLFYDSVDNRKLCCNIRKADPMKRALLGTDAWISGLRREQSVTRNEVQVVEWDNKYNKLKINPLINWTSQDLWEYIRNNKIPYNTLHDKGFPSIGCLPCTRAVLPGEDIRAGRWWWESPANRECGLHIK